MKLLANIIALLALGVCAHGAYVVRISDLQYSPLPPNPIKLAGVVTAVSPLTLNDGSGQVTVTGISALVGDFLIVEGDIDSGTLTVLQDPGKATLLTNSGATEMVYTPAGFFQMGNNGYELYSNSNELPAHIVVLPGYWIGTCEVTRGEYRAFMDAGGYDNSAYWSTEGWSWRVAENVTEPVYWEAGQNWGSGSFTQTDQHPVVGVRYYEAEAFCNWANGRLPTEAEWERAARWDAGYPNVYPWGYNWGNEKCNNRYDTNPLGGGYEGRQTAPVRSYAAGVSPFGCHDMAGNVSEWVKDWYSSTYYSISPSSNPQGPPSGSSRVYRGGGYFSTNNGVRCAYRNNALPTGHTNSLGFRLAR